MFCSLSVQKKKMKIIKKTRQKKNENKIVFSKIMFVNNLQDIIIK